jgi:hypothetical protein
LISLDRYEYGALRSPSVHPNNLDLTSGQGSGANSICITHDVQCQVLNPSRVSLLKEPMCPHPDVSQFLSRGRTVFFLTRAKHTRHTGTHTLAQPGTTQGSRIKVFASRVDSFHFCQQRTSAVNPTSTSPYLIDLTFRDRKATWRSRCKRMASSWRLDGKD